MAATSEPAEETPEIGPFYEQEPFLQTDKKYYGYVSGVGAGKTFAGVLRTALNMEHWNPGELGAIVAPTTTMVKDVILSEMRDCGLLNHWDYHSTHTEEPGIHAPNGARALILSADNRRTIERLRGLNLAWWWIDEEAEVDERARDILTQRLRVGNYRNGYITTTPKGENHTYDFFVGGIEGTYREHGVADIYETDDRLAILRVPSHANPHTPDDYKEQLDRDHDGQFYEQEVLGRFVQFAGIVYNWFSRDSHVIEDVPDKSEFDEFIYGVDWGYSHPAVVLALGRKGDDYYVLEEFYQRRCTVSDLETAAFDMQDRWMPGPMYCDSAEPSSIEQFNRAGLDARPAEKAVTAGIQKVSSYNDNLYVRDSCQNVINEFGMYQYDDDDDAKDEPIKQNDHAMDSLRYALMTHTQKTESVSTVGSMRDLMG